MNKNEERGKWMILSCLRILSNNGGKELDIEMNEYVE